MKNLKLSSTLRALFISTFVVGASLPFHFAWAEADEESRSRPQLVIDNTRRGPPPRNRSHPRPNLQVVESPSKEGDFENPPEAPEESTRITWEDNQTSFPAPPVVRSGPQVQPEASRERVDNLANESELDNDFLNSQYLSSSEQFHLTRLYQIVVEDDPTQFIAFANETEDAINKALNELTPKGVSLRIVKELLEIAAIPNHQSGYELQQEINSNILLRLTRAPNSPAMIKGLAKILLHPENYATATIKVAMVNLAGRADNAKAQDLIYMLSMSRNDDIRKTATEILKEEMIEPSLSARCQVLLDRGLSFLKD